MKFAHDESGLDSHIPQTTKNNQRKTQNYKPLSEKSCVYSSFVISISCKTASSCFKRSGPHILSTSSSEIEKTTSETSRCAQTVTNHLFYRLELRLSFFKIAIRMGFSYDIVLSKINRGKHGARAQALHSDYITLSYSSRSTLNTTGH